MTIKGWKKEYSIKKQPLRMILNVLRIQHVFLFVLFCVCVCVVKSEVEYVLWKLRFWSLESKGGKVR